MADVKAMAGDHFARHLEPGSLVAVSDGAGMPSDDLLATLSEVCRRTGGVRLLLGWCIGPRPGLDLSAFGSVRTLMGGYQLRHAVRDGRVGYVPARLGSIPSLLAGPLRPDVLVTTMVPKDGGLNYGTEVGWAQSAAESARVVLVEQNDATTSASALPDVSRDEVTIIATSDRPPDCLSRPSPDAAARRIGVQVAALVPEGAAIQVGPGTIAEAFLGALAVPVRVDSGVLIDAVMDLDERGLLLGQPTAAYLAGSPELYAWAGGRPILRGVDHTHDISRLAARPLIAVNTALEIDLTGQVNVEGVDGVPVAGIGGHADYALAASRSRGLSVVALPTRRSGHTTLVERLSTPTSTARSDIDVVVTEMGAADLRGLPDSQRSEVLLQIWGSDAP